VTIVPKHWIKQLRQVRGCVNSKGNKVLVKNPNAAGLQAAPDRSVSPDWPELHNRKLTRARSKNAGGDAGVVAFSVKELANPGSSQKIELRTWQIEEKRTCEEAVCVESDTWYRLKIRAENSSDGRFSSTW